MKFYSTLISVLILFGTYCQEISSKDLVKLEYEKFPKSIKEDPNFNKAYHSFLKDEHDSTLVYSHHFIVSHGRTNYYSNFCRFFRALGFYDKELFTEALWELKLLPKTFPLYSRAMLKRGTINLQLGNYSRALHHFSKIEDNSKIISKSILLHNIGLCYLHLNEFGKSEEKLLESLSLQEKEQDTSLLVSSYMDIANLYYVQYNDKLAIPYFEKAYKLSKFTSDFELKQNAALNMAAVEENRENFEKSIAYRKEYEQWNDSINDQNKVWAVAELEKEFISKQKQKEIEILEKENALKKAQVNSFIYSSVLLSLLAIALLYFYLSKRKANKIILSQKNELDVLNDTKDRLFSVVSHDLRSNVNAIDKNNLELTESFDTKDYDEVGQQIQQGNALTSSTKSLLDNMLNWAMLQTDQLFFQQENLNLRSIVKHVTQNYEPLLNSKNINLETTIPQNTFIYADAESLKIVLRNIIDNAIKFSNSGDQISIYSKVQSEKFCQLIIEDTGSGMSEEVLSDLLLKTLSESKKVTKERTGLGLHLCQAMMLKNEGALNIESEENVGTKIIISIPLSQDNE